MVSDKHDKKRKRDSDRHDRPSKKPALNLQHLPPLKASVVDDNSELAPVIITTPGVNAPKDLHLKPYFKSREYVQSKSRNKGIASSEILLQSSEHPKMDFVGREAEDDADSQLKHYIAVVDPEKKTWQFVEARKVTLRGGVRQVRSAEDEEEESEDDGVAQTMRAQKTELTNTFGTKQSRKVVQSMAENAQLSNAPAGAANAAESALLSSMPADAAGDIASKSAAVQAEIQASKPIPPANLAATHPSDVYPLEVLVPNGHSTLRQLNGINEWATAFESGQGIVTSSRYISRRIENVMKAGDKTHIQILRFILLLLELSRSLKPSKDSKSAGPGSKRLPQREDLRRILSSPAGASNQSAEPLPDPLIDSVRRKFAPGGSVMSKNEVTLLHTTICALTLHIPPQPGKDGNGGNTANELATDPSDLRDDLRLDNNTISHYFRELGCRVDKPRESEFAKWNVKGGKAEAAARRVARLRVPVEFPRGFIDGVIWAIGEKSRQDLDGNQTFQIKTDSSATKLSDLLANKHPDWLFPFVAPQCAILDHESTTKLYFTHGGGSSANEALYHGKPLIAMGFFFDQIANTSRLVAAGVAESLNKFRFTSNELYAKAKQILQPDENDHGSSYLRNVLRMKRIAHVAAHRRDYAADLVEELMYDNELRFSPDDQEGGSRESRPMHLQTADMRMPAYKAKNWDLYAVCFLGASVLMGSTWLAGRCLWSFRAPLAERVKLMVGEGWTRILK